MAKIARRGSVTIHPDAHIDITNFVLEAEEGDSSNTVAEGAIVVIAWAISVLRERRRQFLQAKFGGTVE